MSGHDRRGWGWSATGATGAAHGHAERHALAALANQRARDERHHRIRRTAAAHPDWASGRIATHCGCAPTLVRQVLPGRRPRRVPTAQEWRAEAACAGLDVAAFFPEEDEDAAPALAVCARCRVMRDCAAYAAAIGTRDGIWGGLTGGQRRSIAARAREETADMEGTA